MRILISLTVLLIGVSGCAVLNQLNQSVEEIAPGAPYLCIKPGIRRWKSGDSEFIRSKTDSSEKRIKFLTARPVGRHTHNGVT